MGAQIAAEKMAAFNNTFGGSSGGHEASGGGEFSNGSSGGHGSRLQDFSSEARLLFFVILC
jgi:hypothetical protein